MVSRATAGRRWRPGELRSWVSDLVGRYPDQDEASIAALIETRARRPVGKRDYPTVQALCRLATVRLASGEDILDD